MGECLECYSSDNRATPLLKAKECLENHTQYICGTCGRCICIEKDDNRQLQRWNFPFKTLEIAKLYLRTADYTTKNSCGIYEIVSETGRISYKIFSNDKDFSIYLEKSKKTASSNIAGYQKDAFQQFSNTKIKKLTPIEIEEYLH